jgi:hypothetical protein
VSTDLTLWERVDERVLRWLAAQQPTIGSVQYRFETREPVPDDDLPGLSSLEVHESLERLESYGLVDGRTSSAMANTTWTNLRVTALGLIILGEWPDLDRVATAASVHLLLRALAEEAPESEKSALRRAAGVVGRTGDDIVRGTVADLAKTAGRELGGK